MLAFDAAGGEGSGVTVWLTRVAPLANARAWASLWRRASI